jgi:hypothetical protein
MDPVASAYNSSFHVGDSSLRKEVLEEIPTGAFRFMLSNPRLLFDGYHPSCTSKSFDSLKFVGRRTRQDKIWRGIEQRLH